MQLKHKRAIKQRWMNIQSSGSEQQPSKSECHSSDEPLDEINSCVEETEDVFL